MEPRYFGRVKILSERKLTAHAGPGAQDARGSHIPGSHAKPAASCWLRQLPGEGSRMPHRLLQEPMGPERAAAGPAPKWGGQQEGTTWGL